MYDEMNSYEHHPQPSLIGSGLIELDNVPLDIMSQYEELSHTTATNVFDCAIKNQSRVITLHGPDSEHEGKNSFPQLTNDHIGNDFYIPKNKIIHFHPTTHSTSLILSGIIGNTIIIHNKVNHILIRRSTHTTIDIEQGTVSGVDIVHCNQMIVKMPFHNFTNIEYGESINFQGQINLISQLHISGSLNVKINNISLPINPFINAALIGEAWNYKESPRIPKLMFCRY